MIGIFKKGLRIRIAWSEWKIFVNVFLAVV